MYNNYSIFEANRYFFFKTSWVFDKISGQTALEATQEPIAECISSGSNGPFASVLVLHPGGISLRMSPHMSSPKADIVARYLETREAKGFVSSADGLGEKYMV